MLERLRIELTEADSRTTAAREAAHAHELEIGRLQQQIQFDQQQIESLSAAAADIDAEVRALDARREPARVELETRKSAAARALAERDAAASALHAEEIVYGELQANIEGLEGDVEAARSEVFAAVNAATALRHAMEHAAAARTRIAEQISHLDVERGDLDIEAERAARDRAEAEAAVGRAREAMESLRVKRSTSESALAGARTDRDARLADLRTRERGLAGIQARLGSLEELAAARAEYGDAARRVLAESNGDVGQMGSVADYLDVDKGYERAVEACLGDLLQHVVVQSHAAAAAGFEFVRTNDAGRVGFLVANAPATSIAAPVLPASLTPLLDVVRVNGPAADAIRAAVVSTAIARDFDSARSAAETTTTAIVTLEGEVFRGAHVIEGGTRAEARGILTTRREIQELRERAGLEALSVERLREEIGSLDLSIATEESSILSLQEELHRLEKSSVGFELQVANGIEAIERVRRKHEQIAVERRSAEEELRAQDARHEEARDSIARIQSEQRTADDLLNSAQRRLFEAREAMQVQSDRTSEAKAAHAALVERASALASEIQRLQESATELEARIQTRRDDLQRNESRRAALVEAIAASQTRLDDGLHAFDELRDRVRTADEASQSLRTAFEGLETRIREARRTLESVRTEVAQLDVTRATAESDLAHLASSCVESVQASLDEVAAEVSELEQHGVLATAQPIDDAPEPAEVDGEPGESVEETATTPAAPARVMTADEMVADLRAKIERMGAVNMMAIDQFDDLESRHAFLTTQRKDLIDSIAATGEAIRRIDKTTKERFKEAFTAINQNFEQTFTTLFGGGRAGLVLLDETDQLESGIDIIAQPPGKRLQSVQLLSGGEKALTAMALMFAIFKYRPSPFCLLDEIDAPLDDANIGRFVEMLQGMQEHTQFILITHNRKTMEIADRLYGVTMEEPGVSKLISVQLN
jgi:chromosome segregation protein